MNQKSKTLLEMNGRQLFQFLAMRSRELATQRGEDVDRVRKKIAFDFALHRLAANAPSVYVLKGGYAIELKFGMLRATKDLDLFTRGLLRDVFRSDTAMAAKKLRQRLVDHLATPASDGDRFVRFRVGDDVKVLRGGGGGIQMTVRMVIESQLFAEFSIDLSIEDIKNPPHEAIRLTPIIQEFSGAMAEQEFELPTNEMIWAEKLHCYMRHGEGFTTRVKDFVDLVVVGRHGIAPARAKELIQTVFTYWQQDEEARRLPSIPKVPTDANDLRPPPGEWEPVYSKMAKELGIDVEFSDAHTYLKKLLKSILTA